MYAHGDFDIICIIIYVSSMLTLNFHRSPLSNKISVIQFLSLCIYLAEFCLGIPYGYMKCFLDFLLWCSCISIGQLLCFFSFADLKIDCFLLGRFKLLVCQFVRNVYCVCYSFVLCFICIFWWIFHPASYKDITSFDSRSFREFSQPHTPFIIFTIEVDDSDAVFSHFCIILVSLYKGTGPCLVL